MIEASLRITSGGKNLRTTFRQVQNKPYKIPSVLFGAHHGKLPPVMQESEVLAVIQAISNLKYKTVIILLYSTGMRLSEIANLKIADIESKQLRIKIVSGKGNSPRWIYKIFS